MITNKGQISTNNYKGEHLETNDFLSCGNLSAKDEVEEKGNKEIEKNKKDVSSELLKEIENLNATELRNKYPRTYKCWDNMKQRKHKGAIIHPEFDKFKDFLRHLGPCENPQYTLDRLDNDDPEYAPGKVEWRDSYAQNSNKGNNVILTHDDGRKYTIAQWAKITKQKPATLYKRYENGWSDMAVITGDKAEGSDKYLLKNPWPYEKKHIWEKVYVENVMEGRYNQSRLNFLLNTARAKYSPLLLKKDTIECAIAKKRGFDDYDEEGAFEEYVYEKGYNLKQYQDFSIVELEEQLSIIIPEFNRWENILKQSSAMVKYLNKKKEIMSRKGDIILKDEALNFLHSVCQKPAYTLHLPNE